MKYLLVSLLATIALVFTATADAKGKSAHHKASKPPAHASAPAKVPKRAKSH